VPHIPAAVPVKELGKDPVRAQQAVDSGPGRVAAGVAIRSRC
jgi:hypothetical protein